MIGHLYRYPHPFDTAKFLYVGQGIKRDYYHRSGKSSFGRRFKRDFPNVELPQPVREQIEIQNHTDLNEFETIWMFRYHTWKGYVGGMNLTFPGSKDYLSLGNPDQLEKIRTVKHQREAGRKGGLAVARSGQLDFIRNLPQTKKACSENGKIQIQKNRNSPRQKESIQRRIERGDYKKMAFLGAHGGHEYWHVRRNIVKKDCKFCEVF